MGSTHDYEIDLRNENIMIYIDGQFFHRSDAKVSVMDSGYLLGDGVWEGIRLYNNHLIHLEKHLERLYEGAETIQMEIGIAKSEMKSAIEKTLKKNKMISDVHIRLIVSRGIKSTPYQHPKVTIGHPTIVIIPEHKKPSPCLKIEGITLGTVSTIRNNLTQDPRVNSLRLKKFFWLKLMSSLSADLSLTSFSRPFPAIKYTVFGLSSVTASIAEVMASSPVKNLPFESNRSFSVSRLTFPSISMNKEF